MIVRLRDRRARDMEVARRAEAMIAIVAKRSRGAGDRHDGGVASSELTVGMVRGEAVVRWRRVK